MAQKVERKWLVEGKDWQTPEVMATGKRVSDGYFTQSGGKGARIVWGHTHFLELSIEDYGTPRVVRVPITKGAPNARNIRYSTDINSTVIVLPGYEARVRLEDGSCTVTLQRGQAPLRTFYEYDVDPDDGPAVLKLTSSRVVKKTRYEVPLDGELVAALDVYDTPLRGLVMAEVEVPAVDAPVTVPDYFGPEVTGHPHYLNAHLAYREVAGQALTM